MAGAKEQVLAARSGAARSGFFHIADSLGVTADEARIVPGDPVEPIYCARGAVVRIPADTLRRISCVAGIHNAVPVLHSDPQNGPTGRWAATRPELSGADPCISQLHPHQIGLAV